MTFNYAPGTRFMALSLLAVLFTAALLYFPSSALAVETGTRTNGAIGEQAPDFELPGIEGPVMKLSSFKGRPVLLYFWATWCPSCIQAKPEVAKIRTQFPESALIVLGVNAGAGPDSLERVKKYQKGHPATYPILYDNDSAVSRLYQVQGIPLFVVIDKDGKVVYRANELPPNIGKLLS